MCAPRALRAERRQVGERAKLLLEARERVGVRAREILERDALPGARIDRLVDGAEAPATERTDRSKRELATDAMPPNCLSYGPGRSSASAIS